MSLPTAIRLADVQVPYANPATGRQLTTVATVRILGEQTLNTPSGPVHMLKIAPPPFEYRWIKGDYIVAAGTAGASPFPVASARLSEPVSAPNGPAPRAPAASGSRNLDPFADPFPPRPAEVPGAKPVASSDDPYTATKDRLSELDQRYLKLTQQTPDQWNLEQLMSDYENLLATATSRQRAGTEQRPHAL